jgi:hypothetical protein
MKEIQNLLQSSSHYHKLYALRLVTNFLKNDEELVFKVFFSTTNKMIKLVNIVCEGYGGRRDFFNQIVELKTRVVDKLFDQRHYRGGPLHFFLVDYLENQQILELFETK